MRNKQTERTMPAVQHTFRALRCLFLAFSFVGTAAYGETILMRSGETYRGQIVVYDAKEVTIRIDGGT